MPMIDGESCPKIYHLCEFDLIPTASTKVVIFANIASALPVSVGQLVTQNAGVDGTQVWEGRGK